MYWCEECGAVEKPQFAYDSTGMYEVCPNCKGELTNADRCGCGNWMDPTEFICEDCKKFLSRISEILLDAFEEQTGREANLEHIKEELIDRWISQ